MPAVIARTVSTQFHAISCISGHLPLHRLAGYLDKFLLFTILRDPLERVLSLYRFTKFYPEEYRRLGFPDNFSLGEFLQSRHPEVYGQTHDGMTRMLSGEPLFNNPQRLLFWISVTMRYDWRCGTFDISISVWQGYAAHPFLAQQRWAVPYKLRSTTRTPPSATTPGKA